MRLKGGAMNTIYIGVDFHARQQTSCYLTTEGGEVVIHQLKHQDKDQVRAFYAQFSGRVIVGLEASGYSPWFEALLEELGCEVWLGDATEIRRRARWRQKNDRRDAELILDLLIHDEFPRLHRPSPQSREILRMLRYRQKLIKIRTMGKNSLQALALQSGLAKRSHLFTKTGQQELRTAQMSPAMQWQREQWFQLLEPLNERLVEIMLGIKEQSQDDARIQLLRTLLVEAAHTAVKKDDDLKRFYQRLATRRGRPKAKTAAARKLLIRTYIMLRDEIDYAEFRRRAVAARLARQSSRPSCL